MDISIIAAKSQNDIIGNDNKLIWYLPDDLRFFKNKTLGHYLLMGRKTYQSLGKKLIGRTIIIVTRDEKFVEPDCIVVNNIEAGINAAQKNGEKELFICGGGEIYDKTIEIADKLYITEVNSVFSGDTFFPPINKNVWNIKSNITHEKDEKHKFSFSFVEYERKK